MKIGPVESLDSPPPLQLYHELFVVQSLSAGEVGLVFDVLARLLVWALPSFPKLSHEFRAAGIAGAESL